MKVLILFGHPGFHNSTVNKFLLEGIDHIEGVTFHNLYEEYPEMDIDVDREQELLSKQDCIVFMFPMFWYSTPAIFKEWQDLVLEHGWAYGSQGKALNGKLFFSVVSTGASRNMYQVDGLQKHTVRDFLAPLEQMATLCNMIPLPPFVTHGGNKISEAKLQEYRSYFHSLLKLIAEDKLFIDELGKHEYMCDFIKMGM